MRLRHWFRLRTWSAAFVGLVPIFSSAGGNAEPVVALQVFEPGTAGLYLRLPASWEQVKLPEADATYVDPDRTYWRFQLSTFARPLAEEAIDAPLIDLVSGVATMPGNSAVREVMRGGDDRGLFEYENRTPGIAPTWHWRLFDRSGAAIRSTLFTLSVYPNYWTSPETVELVNLLRAEIWAAQYRKPIDVDDSMTPIGTDDIGRSAELDAIGRLRARPPQRRLSA
jgi:hypothetical protein